MTFFGVGLLPNVNQCIFSMGLELNHLPVYHLLYSANTYTLIHAHTRHMCCVLSDDDNSNGCEPKFSNKTSSLCPDSTYPLS